MKKFSQKSLIGRTVLSAIFSGILIAQGMVFIGCGKVLQTLETVLAKAGTAKAIVNTAIDLYNLADPTGADPGLKSEVDEYIAEGVTDLNTLVDLINTFKADIGSAPATKLREADAIVAAIQSNGAKLNAAFHVKSAKAQAEAAAIVDGVSVFLTELASFLPASMPAPAAHALTAAHQAKTGKAVKIISAKDYAEKFNSASAKNFPQIKVAVP